MSDSSLGYTPGSGADVASIQDGSGKHHQKAVIEQLDASGQPQPVAPGAPLKVEADVVAAIMNLLQQIAMPLWIDPTTGRLRISLDAIASSLTLSTVTTVNGVTSVTSVGNVANVSSVGSMTAGSVVGDGMQTAWAQSVRGRVQ